jgi:hypothetical protein
MFSSMARSEKEFKTQVSILSVNILIECDIMVKLNLRSYINRKYLLYYFLIDASLLFLAVLLYKILPETIRDFFFLLCIILTAFITVFLILSFVVTLGDRKRIISVLIYILLGLMLIVLYCIYGEIIIWIYCISGGVFLVCFIIIRFWRTRIQTPAQ